MKCAKCNTDNQPYVSYCKECGTLLAIPESPWPQAGGTSRRCTCCEFKNPNGGNWILQRKWGIEDANIKCEPIIAGDRTVFLTSKDGKDIFVAHDLASGTMLWQCDTFQTNLTTLSAPVCFGAFVYFVTAEPNYLQRIHLASGMRELVALDFDGELSDTIPGRLCKQAAPLLIGGCASAKMASLRCGKQPCMLLSDRGLIFVHLQAFPTTPLAVVQAHEAACAIDGRDWTTPALMNQTILATDKASGRVVYANLKAYPTHMPVRIERPKFNESTVLVEFTPCIAFERFSGRNMYIWAARDADNKLYAAYRLEDGTFGMKAMDVTIDANGLGTPATDGVHLFFTGRNQNGKTLVHWRDLDRSPEDKPINDAFTSEKLLYIDRIRQHFFVAKEGCPALFFPHGGQIELKDLTPYFTGKNTTSSGKPVAGNSQVLVTTNEGLVCYEIS